MRKRNQYKYYHFAFEIYRNAKVCTKCYTTKNICVHHKNENIEDNNENNLQILCKQCHTRLHNKWKVLSEYTKNKMSIAKTWVIFSDTHRKNIWKAKLWFKHSNESKIKIWLSGIWRGNKSIKQYSLEWNFIKEFKSVKLAAELLWINRAWISQNLIWKAFTCWWYKFTYA